MQHDGVKAALFSPDGGQILSWSSETLRLWDAKTNRQVGIQMRSESALEGAVFSRDARRILSWSNVSEGVDSITGIIQLWDVTTMQPIGPPLRVPGVASAYVLSGRTWDLVAVPDREACGSWDVSWPGQDLFQVACAFAPMMSSKEEIVRLSDRYGLEIGEPICQKDVHIPEPDWSVIKH